ncbi:MAG TPA: DUF1707 domain-containing protein [Trebonia sp.]
MRVSDAEREAAAAELREHFASGRLTSDELDDRLTAAFSAKTRGDLKAPFTDLPPSGAGQSGPGVPGGRPSGAAPFGPRAAGWGGWPSPAADAGDGQRRGDWRASAGRGIGRLALTGVLIWAVFVLGILGVFGIGTGRPLGVILVIAAFALLRRLVFILIGRRLGRGRGRGPYGRGPRRRC